MANLQFDEKGACDSPEMIEINFKNEKYKDKIETGLKIMHNKNMFKKFENYEDIVNFLYKKNKNNDEIKQLEQFKNKFIEIFYKKDYPIIKDIKKEVFEIFFDIMKYEENDGFGELISFEETPYEYIKDILETNFSLFNDPIEGMTNEQKEYYKNEYQKNDDKII